MRTQSIISFRLPFQLHIACSFSVSLNLSIYRPFVEVDALVSMTFDTIKLIRILVVFTFLLMETYFDISNNDDVRHFCVTFVIQLLIFTIIQNSSKFISCLEYELVYYHK